MILTVEELRKFVTTDKTDEVLSMQLAALEQMIHGYTHNNFRRFKNAEGVIEYPADIKMGCVDILRWKLRNEAANSGDTTQKAVQSETISRHSVTYAADASETDIDERFGVPKKHTAFLRPYMKARFGQGLSV